MDTIFMNSENSKTSDPHRLLLNLSDKKDLKGSDKYVSLSSFSIYYIWKKSYKNNKFKISEPTCNEELELQGYFEWIMKKNDTFTDDPAIRRYVNKIGNKITFRIKKGYYLQL